MSETLRRRGRPGGLTGRALIAVARDVLLERGYQGTTMDEVANRARISKVSLYREHSSKAALYAAVVADWTQAGHDAMRPAVNRLLAEPDVRSGLLQLGASMQAGILSQTVLEMRRLVTSEAPAHPEVAKTYLNDSWQRNIATLADALSRLHEQHRLHVDAPRIAANQFTWLVIGAPLNEQLLTGHAVEHPNADTLHAAVDLFLAGHRRPSDVPGDRNV